MGKYLKLAHDYTKHQYALHLLVCLLFCLLSGCFLSFRNLMPDQVAKVMEMYAVFAGIILLTPIFMPEQDADIWALEKSKSMPMWQQYLVRILEAVLALAVVVIGFEILLKNGKSEFDAVKLGIGAFSEMLFLGGIGFFFSAVTNQVVIGYMLAVIYYVANIGMAKHFYQFALFQMVKGKMDFWGSMLAGGAIWIAAGIGIRERKNR